MTVSTQLISNQLLELIELKRKWEEALNYLFAFPRTGYIPHVDYTGKKIHHSQNSNSRHRCIVLVGCFILLRHIQMLLGAKVDWVISSALRGSFRRYTDVKLRHTKNSKFSGSCNVGLREWQWFLERYVTTNPAPGSYFTKPTNEFERIRFKLRVSKQ
jgi:hypothetical protein